MIAATKQTLAFAQLGLSDLVESEDRLRQVKGVADVVAYGQAVTTVLAHIATFDEAGWDAWWQPRSAEMKADPLCRYFWEGRTVVLKDGTLPVWESNWLNEPEPPAEGEIPYADLGSTGQLPKAGSLRYQTYFKSSHIQTRRPLQKEPTLTYVPLPKKRSSRMIILTNTPTLHLGTEIKDITAQGLCMLYVQYLGNLVRDAIAKFSSDSNSSSA